MPIENRGSVPRNAATETASMYWEAFGTKMERAIGPRERGVAFLASHLAHDRALVALGGGELAAWRASTTRAGR
ncbi:MAG: hypothetical protein ACE5GC_00715 [Acidimicrobiia bacterium]